MGNTFRLKSVHYQANCKMQLNHIMPQTIAKPFILKLMYTVCSPILRREYNLTEYTYSRTTLGIFYVM